MQPFVTCFSFASTAKLILTENDLANSIDIFYVISKPCFQEDDLPTCKTFLSGKLRLMEIRIVGHKFFSARLLHVTDDTTCKCLIQQGNRALHTGHRNAECLRVVELCFPRNFQKTVQVFFSGITTYLQPFTCMFSRKTSPICSVHGSSTDIFSFSFFRW